MIRAIESLHAMSPQIMKVGLDAVVVSSSQLGDYVLTSLGLN